MEYIIRALTFALIPIIVNGVFTFLRKPKEAEKGKVHLPKFFAILGAITSSVFLVPAIITAFSDEEVWVPVCFLAFSLLGATLIIAFMNCRISYDDDGFLAKTFFGIKRKFTYDQITAIKENLHETFIYIGKRRVMVDEYSIGGKEFIGFAGKKYSAFHGGRSIPRANRKNDIFKGNVTDTTSIIFAYILGTVCIIGFFIFIVFEIYVPKTENNTIEQKVSFVSCTTERDALVLLSSDSQVYKIQYIDDQFDRQAIKRICLPGTWVTAYSLECKPKYEDKFYSVQAIKYNDKFILGFEETNRLDLQENQVLIFFPIFFFLLWILFIIFSIKIGRNPEKYSKRVIRMFFKEGSIKY